jgi:predicted ATPase/DNA-binding SARP family transcriptional activator
VFAADQSSESLHIHLLGRGRAFVGERQVTFHGHPKVWPLLAYLALRLGSMVDRGEIAAAFWPDVPDATARSNLRRHVAYLANALDPSGRAAWLVRSPKTLGLNVRAAIWTDVRAFLDAASDECRLRDAVTYYDGDLLIDLDEPWVSGDRERLRGRYIQVLGLLVAEERRKNDIPAALRYAGDAFRADPFREDIVRLVMRLRFESGDRAGAMHEFDRFRMLLRDELMVEPAPETVALAETLRTNAPGAPRQRTLPLENTSFVGRAAELAQIRALLGNARLITVAGAPGVGKTRLALRLAREVEAHFADGVRFADLTAARTAADVDRAADEATDDRSRSREGSSAPLEKRLRGRKMLLVLDNCEQVAGPCAALAERVLRAAPGLSIVATSRTALHAAGEAIFAIAPLAGVDARTLFLERARLARRTLTAESFAGGVIETIVGATDGVPLALELCAARLRLLPVNELVARLGWPMALLGDERIATGGTLRASLESSYVLLSDDERQLFRRLSVFAGKPALDAICAIAAEPAGSAEVVQLLARLVDHSLLNLPEVDAVDARYGLLSAIADFAREKLESEDDAEGIRLGHARHFACLYANRDELLRGAHAHDYFDAVARDHDDLRIALVRLIDEGADAELGARTALALSRFWFDRGYAQEGAGRLESAAASPGLSLELRARLLHCVATLRRNQLDYERAFELFGAALAALRIVGDQVAVGKALATYANAARLTGRYECAAASATEAFEVFRSTGDRYLCGYGLLTAGCVAFSNGDLRDASDYFQRALDAYRAVDAEADVALALGNLGVVAFYQGDFAAARLLAGESSDRARRVGNLYYDTSAMLTLARIAHAEAQSARAGALLMAAVERARAIGDMELQIGCVELAAWLLLERDAEAAATAYAAAEAARRRYGVPHARVEFAEHARFAVEVARRLLPSERAAAATAGRSLSVEEAIARAVRLRVTPLPLGHQHGPEPDAPGSISSTPLAEIGTLTFLSTVPSPEITPVPPPPAVATDWQGEKFTGTPSSVAWP